jgi:hypothetical protein
MRGPARRRHPSLLGRASTTGRLFGRLPQLAALLALVLVAADLAAAVALATADEDRSAAAVKIELVEIKRFMDAQSGAPEDHDQRAGAGAVVGVVAAAHHSDDLFGTGGSARKWRPRFDGPRRA